MSQPKFRPQSAVSGMNFVMRFRNQLRRALLFLLVVAMGVALAVATDDNPGERIDAYIQTKMHEQRIPGLALAVIRDGKIVKTQGYGLANVELNVPVKSETIFQSGSIGKQFTATAVMMLAEEGKVSLDDHINKNLPGAPEIWKDITILQVLSHTSGIKNYSSSVLNYRSDYTENDLLKKAASMPLDFAPGTGWNYSNTGYLVLGILIHNVTGKFYGDFLQERIFKPLGMTATRIISEADIIPNRAAGYRFVRGELKNQEYVSASLNTTADGSLYFDVLDLAKWDAALYTEKILKRADLDQMWTVTKLSNGQPNPGHYGFGWFIEDVHGHKLIRHGGAWQGFTTDICRFVDDQLTIVVLTNLDSLHSSPDDIARGVAGFYVPVLAPPPPPRAIPDKEPQVAALLRELLEKLAAGKPDPAAFSSEAQIQWLPFRAKDYQDDLQELGDANKFELLERTNENDLRVYRYRVGFEGASEIFVLKLTQAGKIADLQGLD